MSNKFLLGGGWLIVELVVVPHLPLVTVLLIYIFTSQPVSKHLRLRRRRIIHEIESYFLANNYPHLPHLPSKWFELWNWLCCRHRRMHWDLSTIITGVPHTAAHYPFHNWYYAESIRRWGTSEDGNIIICYWTLGTRQQITWTIDMGNAST